YSRASRSALTRWEGCKRTPLMADGGLGSFLRHLRQCAGPRPAGSDGDADLLNRFVRTGDEVAFGCLVRRHGPLVLGACRRVLRDAHDAEDAFQATFLVLARRAPALQNPQALGTWLYAVAYRVATRLRAESLRRQAREQAASDPEGSSDEPWDSVSSLS